jgi:hypothetical protein
VNPHSKREKRASAVILAVLAAIAVSVLLVQRNFSPAVTAAMNAQMPADTPVAVAEDGGLLSGIPEGFQALSPSERFSAESLADKIDGRAELYLASGFKDLTCRRFAPMDRPDAWFEVFIYTMASAPDAFAVFSQQRRPDAREAGLGRQSYATDNSLYFTKGDRYMEIVGAAADESARGKLTAFARAVAAAWAGGGDEVDESAWFPPDGLVSNSIELQTENAFGFDRFDRVYLAKYQVADGLLTLFISQRANATEAADLVRGYGDYLVGQGGDTVEAGLPAASAALVRVLDLYELVFACGPIVAGVHEAEDPDGARMAGRMLYDHIAKRQGRDDRPGP